MSATASTAASTACSSSFASPLDLCAKGLQLPENPALAKALEKDSLVDDVLQWRAGHSRSTSTDSTTFVGLSNASAVASERDEETPAEVESNAGAEHTPVAESQTDGMTNAVDLGFVVRNTFLSTPTKMLRTPSLGAFFRERQVTSWPGTRASSPEPQKANRSDDAAASADCQPSTKQVLRLDDVLQQPAIGSAELPTIGSAQHRFGTCKPCAFAHTKGCENGVDCQFCHLCVPGEKKRRNAQRMNTNRRTVAAGAVAGAASPASAAASSPANSFSVSKATLATTPSRDVSSPAAVDSRFLPEVSPMAAALFRQPKFKYC